MSNKWIKRKNGTYLISKDNSQSMEEFVLSSLQKDVDYGVFELNQKDVLNLVKDKIIASSIESKSIKTVSQTNIAGHFNSIECGMPFSIGYIKMDGSFRVMNICRTGNSDVFGNEYVTDLEAEQDANIRVIQKEKIAFIFSGKDLSVSDRWFQSVLRDILEI